MDACSTQPANNARATASKTTRRVTKTKPSSGLIWGWVKVPGDRSATTLKRPVATWEPHANRGGRVCRSFEHDLGRLRLGGRERRVARTRPHQGPGRRPHRLLREPTRVL